MPGGHPGDGRRLAVAAAALAVLVSSPAAHAYDFSLDVRTVGQGYQVRRAGASGQDELLTRRRFTQMLSLGVWNIEPESWRGPDGRGAMYVDVLLRFDRDLGSFRDLGTSAERGPVGTGPIRELDTGQLQILTAVFGIRDLGGRADLQLGRQIHFDLVDFYAFDGLHGRARLVGPLHVEAFGGTEVLSDVPLASPIYQQSGTSPGALSPALRPAQTTVLRPMAGTAAVVEGPRGARARLAYRRSWSATAERRDGEPTSGVNEEKLSLTAHGDWRGALYASVGARWNLLTGGCDDQQLAVRWRPGERWWLEGQYAYLAPSFDGDSIWNVFAGGSFRDLRAGLGLLVGPVELHARGFMRRFEELREAVRVTAPGRVGWGGSAGARLRAPRSTLRLDAYLDDGQGGRRLGVDFNAFWARSPLWGLEGRLTSYAWEPDAGSAMTGGVVFGVQLGSRHELAPGIRLHVIGEDNMGTSYVAQLRLLAILDLDVKL